MENIDLLVGYKTKFNIIMIIWLLEKIEFISRKLQMKSCLQSVPQFEFHRALGFVSFESKCETGLN